MNLRLGRCVLGALVVVISCDSRAVKYRELTAEERAIIAKYDGGGKGAQATPVSLTGAREWSVSAEMFGRQWPLTIDRGTLRCKQNGTKPSIITLEDQGRVWGVNGTAVEAGFRSIRAITRREDGPQTLSASRLSEPRRRTIFRVSVEQCDERYFGARLEDSDSPEAERNVKACRGRLRKSVDVSEAEMELILQEGTLKSWPPLEGPLVSVSALIDAGLALCVRE